MVVEEGAEGVEDHSEAEEEVSGEALEDEVGDSGEVSEAVVEVDLEAVADLEEEVVEDLEEEEVAEAVRAVLNKLFWKKQHHINISSPSTLASLLYFTIWFQPSTGTRILFLSI